VTDPRKPEPDEDLLEFLGGIDEVNEDSGDGSFSDFLAITDVDKVDTRPEPPAQERTRE
jgi:hypothetical protein